jgi:hypothetical protein
MEPVFPKVALLLLCCISLANSLSLSV